MKEFSVALFDDDKAMLAAMSTFIAGMFEKCGSNVSVDVFNSADEFFYESSSKHYDVFFLDIEMPGTDGIKLGKKLKALYGEDIDIIFVSNREERVFESFGARPFGFVRKGNFLKDSADVIESLISSRIESEHMVDFKIHTSIVSINTKDIVYLESQRDYQFLHLKNDAVPLKLTSTIGSLYEQLKPFGFIRIHKAYIVNYQYIRRIDTDEVTTTNNIKIPISRRKLKDVRRDYLQYSKSKGKQEIKTK